MLAHLCLTQQLLISMHTPISYYVICCVRVHYWSDLSMLFPVTPLDGCAYYYHPVFILVARRETAVVYDHSFTIHG